jgi:preprotein translocase SecF subunit
VFDVIGKRNWFFLFSGLILVPGLIAIALTPISSGKAGLQFSVDYTGGTVWEFQLQNKNATVAEMRTLLIAKGITDAEVTQDSANYFTVRTKIPDLIPPETPLPAAVSPSASNSSSASSSASTSASATPTVTPTATPTASSSSSASSSASASATPTASPTATPTASPTGSPTASSSASASATLSNQIVSKDQDGNACKITVPAADSLLRPIYDGVVKDPALGPLSCTRTLTTVGPIISSELVTQALLLILLGSLGILIWVGIRFRSIKFGATALVALLHDVIVVVGIFAILGTIFGVQIDALFVTAMLTVIGFSVHDTIVVFDRIRENKARHAGEPFDQIVNHSILQTFGRSINTSFTVVITLVALLMFAGSAIHYFVLALLIGIISGTYSSIFNASPLLVVWQLWEDHRKAARLAALRGGRRSNA